MALSVMVVIVGIVLLIIFSMEIAAVNSTKDRYEEASCTVLDTKLDTVGGLKRGVVTVSSYTFY
jgi:hypothetical protein